MKWPWQRREAKASRAQKLLRMISPGEARFMERRPETFAREGYRQNAVVFACVSMIARAVGTMPLKLRAGSRDVDTHPLLGLLARPNPTQSGADLLEALVSDLLISGNSYIERVRGGSAAVSELWRQEPAKMRVIPGELSVPAGFELSDQGQKVRWDADPIRGQSDILQVKTFNPLDVWYGQAPMEAAALAVDNHNEASRWNFRMLKNGAVLSGILTHNPGEDEEALNDEQLDDLKRQLSERWQGAGGLEAGGVMALRGSFSFTPMGSSPKDLHWRDGKNLSASEIALVYGVPGQLIGLPDQQTYANNREARLSFWINTVIPVAGKFLGELNNWLVPGFGEGLKLAVDLDGIEALQPLRERKWERVMRASNNVLTINEVRAELGFAPVGGGDVIYQQSGMERLGAGEESGKEG